MISSAEESLLASAGVNVSCETRQRLVVFANLVQRWGPALNLVSARDLSQIWGRHVADSLQWAGLVSPAGTPAFDLGSGGGFPALPLAIATGRKFCLVEADSRKAAFLREAIRVTGAPATVLVERVEMLSAKTQLVTSRALARLPQLLAWSFTLLEPQGTCLFMKGRGADAEIADAEAKWRMAVEQIPSRLPGGGRMLRITGLSPR